MPSPRIEVMQRAFRREIVRPSIFFNRLHNAACRGLRSCLISSQLPGLLELLALDKKGIEYLHDLLPLGRRQLLHLAEPPPQAVIAGPAVPLHLFNEKAKRSAIDIYPGALLTFVTCAQSTGRLPSSTVSAGCHRSSLVCRS